MALIDSFLVFKPTRKLIWKWVYPFMTRRLARSETLFLNYGFETVPPLAIPLSPADEPDRGCIQLYHHLATQAQRSLRGENVLEVSCGHGGGASYLMRTFQPANYTGLDLNPEGVRFCSKRHPLAGLRFLQGDAENLPFPDSSFDTVLNLEASHCYPRFSRFLAEVARVLRPGGHFHYADFRTTEALPEWEHDLATVPLEILQSREINAEILHGLDRNAARSRALVEEHVPAFLRDMGRDFAALPGSRVYDYFKTNQFSYRSYLLRKPGHTT